MSEKREFESTAAALRREFDASFARPPEQAFEDSIDLVTIRVAGDSYAIRVQDINAIVSTRSIVPIPSTAPGLIGVAGIRGEIVPVFDLATVLGYTDDPGLPGWQILCGTSDPIALAFSDFEGHVRLRQSMFRTNETLAASRRYVNTLVTTNTGPRLIIEIPSISTDLRNRFTKAGRKKEQ